jgi:hypothetical protein
VTAKHSIQLAELVNLPGQCMCQGLLWLVQGPYYGVTTAEPLTVCDPAVCLQTEQLQLDSCQKRLVRSL